MSTEYSDSNDSLVHRSPLWVGILFVALCALAFFGLRWYLAQLAVPDTLPVVSSVTQGDFNTAISAAQKLMQKSKPNEIEYHAAQSLVATSQYLGGGADGGIEAVKTAKRQLVELQGNPQAQAGIVARIMGYASNTSDQSVISEVFKDSPLKELYVADSVSTSLRNVAEYSLALTENSPAHLQVGNWHARQLLRHYDGVRKLSNLDLQKHIDAVKDRIVKADALYADERAAANQSAVGYLFEPQYRFAIGYLYGVLGLFDERYLAKAESSYAAVLEHFTIARNPDGSPFVVLEPRVPYTHLNTALFIHEVGGSARAADVRAQLDKLLSVLATNPTRHQGFFVAYMRSIASSTNGGVLPSRARMAELAAIHSNFKVFLEQTGWKF